MFNPFQGGELDGFQRAPWPASPDHIGFVVAVNALCQSVIVAVVDAAGGGLDACRGKEFGVADADVLAPLLLW